MAIIETPKTFYEYDSKTLKKIQELELMILKEFIRICDENDIEYFLDGGTALGAVRHEGFIPWDDDIDVIMFRKEYDKFLKVMENYQSNKFDFISAQTKKYFCCIFSELNLNGTKTERIFNPEKVDFDIGISIDIFVLDNVPDGYLKEKIFKMKYKIYRKLLFLYEVTFNDKYVSKNKERVGHILRSIFNLLKIDNNYIKRKGDSLVRFAEPNSERVCNLNTPYSLSYYPRTLFSPPQKAKFEDIEANIPKDYDTYLTIVYGDYMTPPPVEDRKNHQYNSVDFGKYDDL